MSAQTASSGRETTIVDNEVYNLLSAVTNKLQALSAYSKYLADGSANDQIFEQLKQEDEAAVRRLMNKLDKLAQQGRLKV